MTTENFQPTKKGSWLKQSATAKLIIITVLMLLLLIPASMVRSIIREREHLNAEAINEVSAKWANSQQINGPILTIPITYEYKTKEKTEKQIKNWHVLPEALNIKGSIEPQKLRRGIYEVVVYSSKLNITGTFSPLNLPKEATVKQVHWDKAFLTVGISDLRGIKNNIIVKWGNQNLKVNPGSKISETIYSGVTIALPETASMQNEGMDFNFTLDLQGSQKMTFVPIGSTTKVDLTSSWVAPSFNGNFLPNTRNLSNEGFQAHWKVLQLNRNFPQTWIHSNPRNNMQEAAFGVDLLLPVDDYQKSMRSAKYAVMTIALTFLIFFLVEILNKTKIHPFQYALVGLGLCLFYIILVAITEHTDFNVAFALSAGAVIAMITLYSLSIFKSKKLTLLLLLTMLLLYGFLFVTLQLTDYALLMGSIGLFLILTLTMYFTRNIDWYKISLQD